MKWGIRIAAIIVGTILLTFGKGLRGAAAVGEMGPTAGTIGVILSLGAMALIFAVFFVWEKTKVKSRSR